LKASSISSRLSVKPVAETTASQAAARASVTDCFFSLRRSSIGDMMVERYLEKLFFKPLASTSTQFAATRVDWRRRPHLQLRRRSPPLRPLVLLVEI
ncbi:hypothetical protein KCU85_g490, partial [Aureobasidium melanogenum]